MWENKWRLKFFLKYIFIEKSRQFSDPQVGRIENMLFCNHSASILQFPKHPLNFLSKSNYTCEQLIEKIFSLYKQERDRKSKPKHDSEVEIIGSKVHQRPIGGVWHTFQNWNFTLMWYDFDTTIKAPMVPITCTVTTGRKHGKRKSRES